MQDLAEFNHGEGGAVMETSSVWLVFDIGCLMVAE